MLNMIGYGRLLSYAKSFGIYGVGVLALSFTDVLINSAFDARTISDWAEVRSLIGVTGILCVVGLDQMFMRSPQSSLRLLRLLAAQIPVLALLVGAVIVGIGYIGSWLAAAALVGGAATAQALSQYFRSHRLFVQAQLVQQSWKIVAFGVFAFLAVQGVPPEIDGVASAIIFGASLVGGMMLLRYPPSQFSSLAPEGAAELYATGARFMVTSLFLAAAMYAEQLLVNGLGSVEEGAKYFAHSTYFFFPASAVVGYLGFVVGPWMRNNHDEFVAILKNRIAFVVVAAGAFALGMNLFGRAIWGLLNPTVGGVDPVLQVIFLVNCFAAALYTIPSGYNGIFGRPREHDLLIAAQIGSLAIAAGVFSLSYYAFELRLVHAVAIAGVVNWALRVTAGFWVTYRISADRDAHV